MKDIKQYHHLVLLLTQYITQPKCLCAYWLIFIVSKQTDTIVLWINNYIDDVMIKFMINSRTYL